MAKEFFGRQHARCEYQDDKVGSIGILGCNRRRGSNTGSDRRPLFVAPPPRTKNKESGRGMTVGRRLYVYMSGHGFSPRPSRGCLFTANATMDFGANVYPSAWLDWFRDSGYFFGVCPLAGLLHESRRHDPSFRGPTCPKNIP